MTPKNAHRLTVWGWGLLAIGLVGLALALWMSIEGPSSAWVSVGLMVIISINALVMLSSAKKIRTHIASGGPSQEA